MGIDKLKLVFQILVYSFLIFLIDASNELCFHVKLQFLQKNNAFPLFSVKTSKSISTTYLHLDLKELHSFYIDSI